MFRPNQTLLRGWSEKFSKASKRPIIGQPEPLRSPTPTLTANLAPFLDPPSPTAVPEMNAVAPFWRAAVTGDPLLSTTLHAREGLRASEGWLVPDLQSEGIEAWQESELICLHALSWSAIRDPNWMPRVRSAALQCIAELQPDNVTGRPWACHVFAWVSLIDNNSEASMYAETLVHNAMVARTDVEPVSAAILGDAAHWLNSL